LKDLAGRVALLTGASSGIGPYIARALREEGVELILSARRRELLQQLADEIGGARIIPADLTKRTDTERLAAQSGEIDILVANAGVPATGKLVKFEPAQVDRAIEVNFRAPIALTRLVLPHMIERGDGHIVLMSSMAGKFAGPNASIYNATKFGLRGFGLALRQELAKSGIGVSTIFPTFVKEAGMWAETGLTAPRLAGEVSPESVADAVVKAIRDNKIEVDVAPWPAKIGGRFVGAVPDLVASVAERVAGPSINLGEEAREKVTAKL
jgi:short-subunit dehydrogenase